MDRASYFDLVRLARTIAPVYSYRDLPESGPALIWRHDCDMSLERALEIAKIDADELGKATFFVHLESRFYNPLERRQREILREISSKGHDIGLHFDPETYAIQSDAEVEDRIQKESHFLQEFLEIELTAVSFHNPTTSKTEFAKNQYSGLVNCSGPRLRNGMNYCSDSNGRWNFKNGFDVLNDSRGGRIQMLTHPEWWMCEVASARQKVSEVVYKRTFSVLEEYDQLLEENGRINDSGTVSILLAARPALGPSFGLLDFLWSHGRLDHVEFELRRLLEIHGEEIRPNGLLPRAMATNTVLRSSQVEKRCRELIEKLALVRGYRLSQE